MMVSREHLYLLMARCYETDQQLAGLNFADADYNQFRNELVRYAQAIYQVDVIHDNPRNRDFHARMAMFILELMSCLVESHHFPLNSELQYVVRLLAAEWNIDSQANVILFSSGPYAVRHYPVTYFNILRTLYRFSFTKQPRIVYVSREYDGDFLFSPIVFHEVGHMVETDRSLAGKVYDEVIKSISSPKATLLKNYFREDYDQPAIDEGRMKAYIKEYIADLFGSQYLGEHILHFFNCHEFLSRKLDTNDHPCYECREKLVGAFINYSHANPHTTSDKFLQIIIHVFQQEINIPNLELRDMNLAVNDLLQGNNMVLNTNNEVFSLFSASWRAAMSGMKAVEAACGLTNGTLTCRNYYRSINNATLSSISRFMVNNP